MSRFTQMGLIENFFYNWKMIFNLSSKFQNRVKSKTWRLFYATDFQSLMYRCFTIKYKINPSNFEIYKPLFIPHDIPNLNYITGHIILQHLNSLYKGHTSA